MSYSGSHTGGMQVHLTSLLARPLVQPGHERNDLSMRQRMLEELLRSPEALRHIAVPKPDAVAWEDTEIDVRRVVL